MVNYLYTLKEVNQMEREMCSYLEWILHVEAAELEAFSQRVRKEYGKDCPAVPPQWVASVGVPPVVVSAAGGPAAAATTAVVSATSLVSTVETSRSQVAAASSLPSPGSSPSSSSSGDSSPDSPDECLTPSSTEDPTQQPTIAHGSGHLHPHTHDATLKAKPISSIANTSIHMPNPSFAFAGPTVW